MQVLAEQRPPTEEGLRTLQEAVTNGGLKLLRDNLQADLDVWERHIGPAAALAPHGPDGLNAARRASNAQRDAVLRRRGIDPASYVAWQGSSSAGGDEVLVPHLVSLNWLD